MDQKRPPLGKVFSEFTSFNEGAAPDAQSDMYGSGCNAMDISAKHNTKETKKQDAMYGIDYSSHP